MVGELDPGWGNLTQGEGTRLRVGEPESGWGNLTQGGNPDSGWWNLTSSSLGVWPVTAASPFNTTQPHGMTCLLQSVIEHI